MSTQEFLTQWTIGYVQKNYDSLNITYDGAYGWSGRLSDKPKVKLSKLVKDLREDFGIVQWVLLEVLWWDETINTTKDDSIAIYNLDGTFIKCIPVDNPNQSYYSEWVWEYYTPTDTDIYKELRSIGLTREQCDKVEELINKIIKNQIF